MSNLDEPWLDLFIAQSGQLIYKAVDHLIVNLTDASGEIVGLTPLIEIFKDVSQQWSSLPLSAAAQGQVEFTDFDFSSLQGSLTIPQIILKEADDTQLLFPEWTLQPGIDNFPVPLLQTNSGGGMSREEIRQRASDIQKAAAISLFKNVVTCLFPGGAATGLPEAYTDLRGFVQELNALRSELDRAEVHRIGVVTIVGIPEINMPEVVITGRPGGPVIVMPPVVITAGGPVIVMPTVVITAGTDPDGIDGTDGTDPDGIDGTDGTDPDGIDGTDGTDPDGIDGTDGTDPDGIDGTDGTDPDGTDPDGIDGTDGTDPDGIDGTDGTDPDGTDPDGIDGTDGTDPDGIDGTDGADEIRFTEPDPN